MIALWYKNDGDNMTETASNSIKISTFAGTSQKSTAHEVSRRSMDRLIDETFFIQQIELLAYKDVIHIWKLFVQKTKNKKVAIERQLD